MLSLIMIQNPVEERLKKVRNMLELFKLQKKSVDTKRSFVYNPIIIKLQEYIDKKKYITENEITFNYKIDDMIPRKIITFIICIHGNSKLELPKSHFYKRNEKGEYEYYNLVQQITKIVLL